RPVAGAVVRAADGATAALRRAVTNASGYYRLPELAPAAYRISTAAPGLEEAAAGPLPVTVDSHQRLDFRLAVAGTRESIEVRAVLQPVEASSSELGFLLDRQRIESLPLNRRDFLQLALLAPGVSPPVEDSQLSQYGSVALHAGGAREDFNNVRLDGADNNDPYVNRYVLQPSVDSIQEYKVATNGYSAEYGKSAGAQINVVTRGGANDLHAFLYEYLRNRQLDARNFFDERDKPKFVRNQFGFGAGGALVRNRAFFFASADLLRERQSLSRLGTVPTPAERQGDLSASGKPVLDPFTRAPFAGGIIPASRVSRVGRKVLDLYPLPNRAGEAANYLAQPVMRQAQSQTSARVDTHPTRKDRLMFRYSFGFLDLAEPYTEDSDAVPGFGDLVRDPAHNATVHHERVLGPNAVNSLRFGFGRFSRDLMPENHATDVGEQWGVDWLRVSSRAFGYPVFNVAGWSRVGDTTSLPILRHTNTYQLQEGLSLIRGSHSLKTGAELRRLELNGTLDLLVRGSLSFSGALSGSGKSDLLLGLPSFGLQSVADNPMTMRTNAYNAYLQDDWRIRPNLTLNLGLRYEFNTPPVDPADRMSTLDPQTGRMVRVGTAGLSRSGLRPDRNNLAPRAGFAWAPARDFVVRGGYGLYYDSGMFIVNTAQYFNPPQFSLRVFFPTAAGLLTLDNPFPLKSAVTPPPSLNLLSPDIAGSYLQHWSFNLQKAFGRQGVASLAYAGSKGTHLLRTRDRNQPRPAPGEVQLRRANRAYGNMLLVESAGGSIYHSLQASFSRPLTRLVSMLASYTLAKSIDDSSAFLGVKADKNFPQDSENLRAERAVSSFDVRHRATLAYILQLPGRNRWIRGTELRGIAVLQSGQPFTPVLRFDNSNTGNTGGSFGSDRPDLAGDPRLTGPVAGRWFDTRAFRIPRQYAFGSAGRNIVRGPGFYTFDVSLARSFSLAERRTVSFEAQAFNLLNHANFNLPELFADEPASFGRVFSAKSPRQVQFALRFSF
ncbi:MAG: TonB-dependent receptor, partial [Acidobacteria bacterium]|nr:TonB-dependent receptor [Acidobacteriota bacterium]